MSTKPTNPKDAIGSSKIPLHLFPTTAKVYGSLGLLDGMLKYGRTNWRAAGIRTSIYYDAINRHLDAWFEGEDIDPDSGLPHLAHAIAGIAILIDGTEKENITDDRMYPTNYRQTMNRLSPEVERLKGNHDESPHHHTIADKKELAFEKFMNGTYPVEGGYIFPSQVGEEFLAEIEALQSPAINELSKLSAKQMLEKMQRDFDREAYIREQAAQVPTKKWVCPSSGMVFEIPVEELDDEQRSYEDEIYKASEATKLERELHENSCPGCEECEW